MAFLGWRESGSPPLTKALWWLSERISTFPYQGRALDPVPLVLLSVALIANWLPARRATEVEPVVALRSE